MLTEEMRRKLLLLQNGMPIEKFNATSPADIKKGLKKVISPGQVMSEVSFQGEYHFPGYNYLGPGTKFKTRQALGIDPINDLDRIAMYHDSQYSRTGSVNSSGLPVLPIGRSPLRGVVDLGAGSAMLNAAYNPWSDLGWTDRGYAAGAGAVLLVQGIARLHPVTAMPMMFIDKLFY